MAVLLLPALAGAEPLSDPLRPPRFRAPVEADAAPRAAPPRLTSTVTSSARRVAIIDGRTVTVGDRLRGMRVVAIEPGRVELRGADGKTTLRLLPRAVTRTERKSPP